MEMSRCDRCKLWKTVCNKETLGSGGIRCQAFTPLPMQNEKAFAAQVARSAEFILDMEDRLDSST